MFKGIMGSIFILVSAILYSTKVLSAAISSINNSSWGEEEFIQALAYTPSALNTLMYLSLALGIACIIWYISEFYEKEKNLDSK